MSIAPTLLSVEGLSKSYGGVHAVRGVSFALKAGEILALIGPNGARRFPAPAGSICSARIPPARNRARSGGWASGVPSKSPRRSRP